MWAGFVLKLSHILLISSYSVRLSILCQHKVILKVRQFCEFLINYNFYRVHKCETDYKYIASQRQIISLWAKINCQALLPGSAELQQRSVHLWYTNKTPHSLFVHHQQPLGVGAKTAHHWNSIRLDKNTEIGNQTFEGQAWKVGHFPCFVKGV